MEVENQRVSPEDVFAQASWNRTACNSRLHTNRAVQSQSYLQIERTNKSPFMFLGFQKQGNPLAILVEYSSTSKPTDLPKCAALYEIVLVFHELYPRETIVLASWNPATVRLTRNRFFSRHFRTNKTETNSVQLADPKMARRGSDP